MSPIESCTTPEIEIGDTICILSDADYPRLDLFLSIHLGISREQVHSLMTQNHVTCPARPRLKPSLSVFKGMTFTVFCPRPVPSYLTPQKMDLTILYEDEAVIVLDKPAGLVVHPAPGHLEGTLVHGLLHHCGPSLGGIGGVERPGIVHRLDKDTSGVMIVAKTESALYHLQAHIQNRTLKRLYRCLTWGPWKVPHGTINAPIGRDPRDRKKMAVIESGRPATSYFKVEEIYTLSPKYPPGMISLVHFSLETGRTHQIRVHCLHENHPILGDPTYGHPPIGMNTVSDALITPIRAFNRQALHAYSLTFIHPITNESMTITSTPPLDFQILLDHLRHYSV